MPDSFDYTTGTNSENVRLLQALIDDAPEYTEETNSRNANILKSIINNTEYTDAPQSEIEELLLRLKAKIGGEIEVDELNVTENGTYNAGVNKAYNPVTVELPLNGKTITENGTYTASDDNLAGFNEVTVDVEGYQIKSIENTPTAIATITDGVALPMPSLKVGIEAQQDLHGYDHPWPAGGGNNKLPLMASIVKSLNTSGTWSGDAYTINNVTFTLETNTEGAITNIKVNSSGATATTTLYLCRNDSTFASAYANQSLILNGCPSGGSEQTYGIQGYRVVNQSSHIYDSGSGTTFTFNADTSNYFFVLFIINGQVVNNISFKPMIRLATVSDSTFAPYSNECPISGWDEVNVNDRGVNIWDEEWENGIYSTSTGQPTPNSNCIRSKNPIPVKPSSRIYNHVGQGTTDIIRILFYDINGNFISANASTLITNGALNIPNNCYFMHFYCAGTYGTTYNNDISINYPSTDTEYHAYNGTTYTTQLKDGQGNPMTCYGGELSNENGVQTLDNVVDGVDLGDLTWSKNEYVNTAFNTTLPSMKTGETGKKTITMASCYNPVNTKGIMLLNNGEIMTANGSTTIVVRNDSYTDATAFKTAMAGQKLVYELATPTTIPQDNLAIASQDGVNNIWADSGDVIEGSYFKELS